MTRSLYVLRHGKSDWDASSGNDAERPLKRRGQRAARAIGRFLARIEERPELVLTSPAVRARATAELALEAGVWSATIRIEPRLYETSAGVVLEVVRELEDEIEHACVVGHQPILSQLIALACGGSPPSFPTGALARIDFEGKRWRDARPGTAALQWLVTPRLIDPAAQDDD